MKKFLTPLLLIAILFSACTANRLSTTGTSISSTELKKLSDRGKVSLIDARTDGEYKEGHIPGALTITSRELEQRLESLTPGTVIIAYGDASRPESGVRGAQIFMELGYPKVIALEGGFQAWRDAGHPVEAQDSVQSTTP